MVTIDLKNSFVMSLLLLAMLHGTAQAEYEFLNAEIGFRGVVPPAPPGPYTSTALLENKTQETVIGKQVAQVKPIISRGLNDASLESSSPDIPWPDDLRPSYSEHSNPWGSSQGGAYEPSMGTSIKAPINNYPAMSSSQLKKQMPEMGDAQAPSGYIPNYNYPGYGYQMPKTFVPQNNYSGKYPMNRIPDPSYYQQGYPD